MSMNVEIIAGNILDFPADVLISTANPWLEMTGGVNQAIVMRPQGDDVFGELQEYLSSTGEMSVAPGTVVCTGPGSLPVKKILHAVSIDKFYGSSIELVAETITRALALAKGLNARDVTLAALATGYGPLLMPEFATALQTALGHDWTPIKSLKVVVLHEKEAEVIRLGLELVE
jgi:O-acetyl-ADP-ribose deacetylase (regulator of RNase III)